MTAMTITRVPASEPVPYGGIAFRVTVHSDRFPSEFNGVPLYNGAILDEYQFELVQDKLDEDGNWDNGKSKWEANGGYDLDLGDPDPEPMETGFVYDDAGRRNGGRKTHANDCVLRAVGILEGIKDYDTLLKRLHSAGWRLQRWIC